MDTYTYASSSSFAFPMSSTRDDLDWQKPSSTVPRYDPLLRLVPDAPRYKFEPQYAHYLHPRTVQLAPGLQSDGTLTSQHPFVARYLDNLHRVSPAEGRREPHEKWWTKGYKERDVNEVLDLDDIELDDFQSECVFVLAALKVLHHPRHPKHFTLWGREFAPKTAERVHALLQVKPCPIASSSGWISVSQSLWLVDAAQASAYPAKKEGKKANNGMLLRKRKAQAAAAAHADASGVLAPGQGERPKKRTRTTRKEAAMSASTSAATSLANGDAEANLLLSALPLPDVVALTNGTSGILGKAAKLELVGVDAPLEPSLFVTPSSSSRIPSEDSSETVRQAASPASSGEPTPTRRSKRKSRRAATASLLTPVSDVTALALEDTPSGSNSILDADEHAEHTSEAARPLLTRARSSSSSCRSTTAVSETGSLGGSGAETAVEPDVDEQGEGGKAAAGGKRKRAAGKAGEDEDEEQQQPKEKAVRTSGRVRRPAAKRIEAAEVAELGDDVLQAELSPLKKAASPRKTASRARSRSTRKA